MADIWEVAKNIEKEGQQYYLKLAKEAAAPELAGIFGVLAAEEARHLKIFEGLQNNAPVTPAQAEDAVVQAVRAFEQLMVGFRNEAGVKSAVEGYRKAVEMEKKTVVYYTGLLPAATSVQKQVLDVVIAEEKKHVSITESLLEFANRPREWLENAEFSHLEEQY
jgi:rubrerythrin